MAISPNHLNEAFVAEVNAFEKALDAELSKHKITVGGSTTVHNIPTGYSSSHHVIIAERYKAAGWKEVTYNNEYREGSWITFKS